jgi:ATP-dependent Clp protease ATP-binding subunit ClpC
MFERYTEKAIKVIMLSQEESRRLGHNFVGTEQILLGLIGQGTGIAAKVLRSMGVNLKDARIEVEKIVGRGSGFVALEIPFTPGAKRVLEFAQAESEELGHNYIGTEHLLLGLIDESENKAVRVMETLGVDLTKVRPQVVRMLGETTEVISESPSSPITVQQIEMLFLLKSIETKTIAIDRAVDELKKDIAALRRCIT